MVPKELSISSYIHCTKCLAEKPDNTSPSNWARLAIGLTKEGLQVWCKRHEMNVVHIDFQGHRHPANVNN